MFDIEQTLSNQSTIDLITKNSILGSLSIRIWFVTPALIMSNQSHKKFLCFQPILY